MKKFIAVIFTLLLFSSLTACETIKPYLGGGIHEEQDNDPAFIEEPTSDYVSPYSNYENSSTDTAQSTNSSSYASNGGNGQSQNYNNNQNNSSYKSKSYQNSKSKQDNWDGVYCANQNTKKFHKSTCGSAKTIKETNLYTTTNRDELINEGYEPCLRCHP